MTISNFDVLVVVSASPVFDPCENPLNVIVPADPLLVILTTQFPSFEDMAKVNAPPLVRV